MKDVFVYVSRQSGRFSDAARNERISRRDLIACFTFQCYRRFLRRIELLIFLKAIAKRQRANLTKYFLSYNPPFFPEIPKLKKTLRFIVHLIITALPTC